MLYVGRYEQQKGLFMLLEAFSLIKNKAVTLKLIGKGVLKQELIKRSEELGISSRVDILDYKQTYPRP